MPTLAIDDALPVPPEKAPQPSDSGLELSLDRSVEEEPMPCGLAMTDELTDVATLQRLLVLLGEDPGPVDGFLGARSFAAMEAYVSNPGWETPISDLISELSERHCAGLR